jgi:hypothetical protein
MILIAVNIAVMFVIGGAAVTAAPLVRRISANQERTLGGAYHAYAAR